MSNRKLTRRTFLFGSAAAVAAATTVKGLYGPGRVMANSKLNIASVGCGGKGQTDINGCKASEINVAFADVDWRTARRTFDENPDVPKYKDFREMLDKHGKEIDAVTVTTPDHMHTYIAATCMALGKHVYVQKPLTWSVGEARYLRELAKATGVVTQMGNQGHAQDGTREFVEIIESGVIGDVKEVHLWTNRPIWPQGVAAPAEKMPVPEEMDWDLWLGVAPKRAYNAAYAPFKWRGWWDFGAGALGDMACHIADPANWALQLSSVGPKSVELISQEGANPDTFPTKAVIKYEFPARGSQPPITLTWYDGGNLPTRPADVPADVKLGEGDNGTLMVGTKGSITCDTYGDNPRLLPAEKFMDFKKPAPKYARIPGEQWLQPYREWTDCIKNGTKPGSNFDYSGPLTEWVVMGNLSLHFPGQKLEWDAKNMRVTNVPEANKYVMREYRKGYSLPEIPT
jgi:predicted dehydrogenase